MTAQLLCHYYIVTQILGQHRVFYLLSSLHIGSHVFIRLCLSINPCLSSLNWQSKAVHNDHVVSVNFSKQQPHHLQVSTGTSMHYHLQQRQSRNLDAREIVWAAL